MIKTYDLYLKTPISRKRWLFVFLFSLTITFLNYSDFRLSSFFADKVNQFDSTGFLDFLIFLFFAQLPIFIFVIESAKRFMSLNIPEYYVNFFFIPYLATLISSLFSIFFNVELLSISIIQGLYLFMFTGLLFITILSLSENNNL